MNYARKLNNTRVGKQVIKPLIKKATNKVVNCSLDFVTWAQTCSTFCIRLVSRQAWGAMLTTFSKYTTHLKQPYTENMFMETLNQQLAFTVRYQNCSYACYYCVWVCYELHAQKILQQILSTASFLKLFNTNLLEFDYITCTAVR